LVIDSDAHVIETDRTWDYMTGPMKRFRPVGLTQTLEDGSQRQYWLLDGVTHARGNIGLDTPKEAREMSDIDARIHHMDELGVDIHVLYPTLFLRPLTKRPDLELALAHSYNQWLADIYAYGKGRLRWAAVLPTMSIDKAIDELKWARERGAVAAFLRGIENDLRLDNPYFFPLYQAVSDLDMCIGVHAGNGNFAVHDFYGDETGFNKFKLPVIGAFHSLIMSAIPDKFPNLRIGFIEVSAQWVPYVIHDAARRISRRGTPVQMDRVLVDNRVWVACQTDDDLPYVLRYAGENNIVIGTDYGHNDTSTEILALRNIRETGEVEPRVIDKILDDNARALYGL
jgi:predicted TIM-barrel fold metal-dependent hydrolase